MYHQQSFAAALGDDAMQKVGEYHIDVSGFQTNGLSADRDLGKTIQHKFQFQTRMKARRPRGRVGNGNGIDVRPGGFVLVWHKNLQKSKFQLKIP